MDNEKYNTVPMIEKACQIVDIISKAGGEAGISEIARETGLSKSTIYRVLYTLQDWKWIDKDEESDRYRLGLFFLQAGKQVKAKLILEDVAKPVMKRLAEETGESVNLGTIFENRVLSVETVHGQASLMVRGLEPVFDLYCSGIGKLFLCDMTEEELHKYFSETAVKERTASTILTEEKMKSELERIRRAGFSVDNEEYEYGLYCVAAPVKNCEGRTLAGISVSGPLSRMEKNNGLKKIKEAVVNGAAEIEKRMGFKI